MRIGVFCSGGDAPGMNACVRGVVRSALVAGHEVVGIRHGYQGLLQESFHRNQQGEPRMTMRTVSNIVQRGGTILGSSRSEEFRTQAGLRKAAGILQRHGIRAIVPIGGDGTFRGATELAGVWPGQIVGCPGTIDNDLLGSDYTIGFHTAVQTAVEAIDKLRDTAESHERVFLVEVMGRGSGYIGLYSALAGGAEVACLPETVTDVADICAELRAMKQRGKTSAIIVVAEGDEAGGALELNDLLIANECPFPTRIVVLGHLQRGGSPAPADRILGSRLGDFAVQSILAGETGAMAGEIDGRLVLTPFPETYREHKAVPPDLVQLLDTLAR